MKLALASLLAVPAVAFAPTGSFGARRSAMQMSTEASTEAKVRFSSESLLIILGSLETIMFRRREVKNSILLFRDLISES